VTNQKILIADDDSAVRQLLILMLSSNGYTTLVAENGYQLIQIAQDQMPDLLLVDLMMPHLDGYEAIRQLRNDTRTAHIPMLILTARNNPNDVVTGFETGADDYITKPFRTDELLARIKSHLRRASQRPVHNPLTGLAGNILLIEEIRYRIRRSDPFALLYIDLNNFKAFNDTYGFARGDLVLKLVGDVLTESVRELGGPRDFVGHIGGDDFAVITTPERIQSLCERVIARFDGEVRGLYEPTDLKRGYLQGVDRHGVVRRFPITSLAIGGVTNTHRTFSDPDEISRIAAEMKGFAKTRPGSRYAIDGRGAKQAEPPAERRGNTPPAVLIISADTHLMGRISRLVESAGARVWAAPDIVEASAIIDRSSLPQLIIADHTPDEAMAIFCDGLLGRTNPPPVVILMSSIKTEEAPKIRGVSAFLPRSSEDSDLIQFISPLIPAKNPLQ
jgi:DNA-binding response OmpR family regulator